VERSANAERDANPNLPRELRSPRVVHYNLIQSATCTELVNLRKTKKKPFQPERAQEI
jgi:hypothetical protein